MIDSTIDFANIQSKKLFHAVILNVIIKHNKINKQT